MLINTAAEHDSAAVLMCQDEAVKLGIR